MTPEERRATQTRFATPASRPDAEKVFKSTLRTPILVGRSDGVPLGLHGCRGIDPLFSNTTGNPTWGRDCATPLLVQDPGYRGGKHFDWEKRPLFDDASISHTPKLTSMPNAKVHSQNPKPSGSSVFARLTGKTASGRDALTMPVADAAVGLTRRGDASPKRGSSNPAFGLKKPSPSLSVGSLAYTGVARTPYGGFIPVTSLDKFAM